MRKRILQEETNLKEFTAREVWNRRDVQLTNTTDEKITKKESVEESTKGTIPLEVSFCGSDSPKIVLFIKLGS